MIVAFGIGGSMEPHRAPDTQSLDWLGLLVALHETLGGDCDLRIYAPDGCSLVVSAHGRFESCFDPCAGEGPLYVDIGGVLVCVDPIQLRGAARITEDPGTPSRRLVLEIRATYGVIEIEAGGADADAGPNP